MHHMPGQRPTTDRGLCDSETTLCYLDKKIPHQHYVGRGHNATDSDGEIYKDAWPLHRSSSQSQPRITKHIQPPSAAHSPCLATNRSYFQRKQQSQNRNNGFQVQPRCFHPPPRPLPLPLHAMGFRRYCHGHCLVLHPSIQPRRRAYHLC
jgi:hypothetical protein